MGIKLIRLAASSDDLEYMREELGDYIKLAVDIDREILAGGGEYHADCEETLLSAGSGQQYIWGADWYPDSGDVLFGALINIRPNLGNMGMEITSRELRGKIEKIVRALLETDSR